MPLVQTRGAASAQGFGEFAQASAVPNYIEEVFNCFLWTGTSASQIITNGIDIAGKGGLFWAKSRSNASNHVLYDTARGGNNFLGSNTTDQQTNGAGTDSVISSFNSNGVTLGADVGGPLNFSGRTYVGWTFRKQPKFFDVVTYTGDATTTGRAIPHNLGSTPGFVIIKNLTTASDWTVWHRSLTSGNFIVLNTTDAQTSAGAATRFGNGSTYVNPTSTDVTVGGSYYVNAAGYNYVMYVFAHNAGGFGLTGTDNVISCGSFTADVTNSATVNLGYEPQWILVKNASAINGWAIVDTMRGLPADGSDRFLFANSSAAESGGGLVNINATGFYGNGTVTAFETYIYIAIRRGPMAVPTVGTSVFAPVTYAGNSAAQTITAGFRVDMELVGCRNGGQGWEQAFADRLRGNGRVLSSSGTGAEQDWSANLTNEFQSNTGTNRTDAYLNYLSLTFVDWMFQRAPSFFDEVCYTGTGATLNVTHNLGVVPEMMIVKGRNSAFARSWAVYHSALGNTKYFFLNNTSAPVVSSTAWNNTTPTSSVFTVDILAAVNYDATETYVAYLFATCAGVSKVGSYTGNGTTQTINCGFTGGARFVLIRRTDTTGDWYVYDTARGMTVLTDPYLLLNTTAAEVATLGSVTTVSTGFALNSTILAAINVSAGSYIFLAIA